MTAADISQGVVGSTAGSGLGFGLPADMGARKLPGAVLLVGDPAIAAATSADAAITPGAATLAVDPAVAAAAADNATISTAGGGWIVPVTIATRII